MSVEFSTHSSKPKIIRTKTGVADDTIFADGITVPDPAEVGDFPSKGPAGKGGVSAIELQVIPVDATGAPVARGGETVTVRMTQVLQRQSTANKLADGSVWDDVASDAEVIAGANFRALLRFPCNGGRVFFGLESISAAPAGAVEYQIWAKPVAE